MKTISYPYYQEYLLLDIASAILSSASFNFFTYVAWCLSWCSYKQEPWRNYEEESKEKLPIKKHNLCCQLLAGFFRQLRQCVAYLVSSCKTGFHYITSAFRILYCTVYINILHVRIYYRLSSCVPS